MVSEKRTKVKDTKYSRKNVNQAHELKFGESSYQNNFDSAHLRYTDLKRILGYMNNIKNVGDKKEIRKTLDLIGKFTGDGNVEIIGRNGDYGGIMSDLYKIADYLSETKNLNNKSSFDLAKRYKDTLLEKIAKREGQMERIETEYGPHIEDYYKAAAIIGIVGGALFLSYNITGNAVSYLSIKTTPFIGAGLLILGLIAGFFLLKNKKKRK